MSEQHITRKLKVSRRDIYYIYPVLYCTHYIFTCIYFQAFQSALSKNLFNQTQLYNSSDNSTNIRDISFTSSSSLSSPPSLALFLDLDQIKWSIQSLHSAFSKKYNNNSTSRFTHCLAVKSNPTLRLLQFAVKNGMGLEAASIGELVQALRTGVDPDVSLTKKKNVETLQHQYLFYKFY